MKSPDQPFADMDPPPAKVPPDPKPGPRSKPVDLVVVVLISVVLAGAVVYYVRTSHPQGCQEQVPAPNCPHELHKLTVVEGAAICLCPQDAGAP
jgi:hypothetical protein